MTAFLPIVTEHCRDYICGINCLNHPALATALITEVGPKAKEIVMTPGNRLIQKGFQQGLQQSLEILHDILELMIPLKFGETETSQKMIQKIKSISDLATLNTILTAVKNQNSVYEILDLPIP